MGFCLLLEGAELAALHAQQAESLHHLFPSAIVRMTHEGESLNFFTVVLHLDLKFIFCLRHHYLPQ